MGNKENHKSVKFPMNKDLYYTIGNCIMLEIFVVGYSGYMCSNVIIFIYFPLTGERTSIYTLLKQKYGRCMFFLGIQVICAPSSKGRIIFTAWELSPF